MDFQRDRAGHGGCEAKTACDHQKEAAEIVGTRCEAKRNGKVATGKKDGR